MKRSDALAGYLAGLVAVACWSGFVLVSRIGGQGTLEPADTMALRFMVGAVCLSPVVAFHRPWFNARGLALAMTGGIGYCAFVYAAFQHTTAVHASVLLPGLIPFASALLAFGVLGDRPSPLRWMGLALIAVGGALMLTNLSAQSDLLGDVYLILSVSCWALYTVLAKRWRISAWQATTTVAYGCAALFLPFYFLGFESKLLDAPWQELLLQGFYQGVIAVVVAMIFYMKAVERIGPARMGAMMALVPTVSGLAAVPILGEVLSYQALAAIVITTLGALLATGLVAEWRRAR